MAEIFLARGTSAAGVDRYCVLKRILRERADDLRFVRMFLDEARLAAQLNHPNVAQVYDIGRLADSYFFTMEFVHGETVRALLQRARVLRRELPLGAIFTIMAGAAAGLHHAHERLGIDGRPLGIVHRDVSLSNLMISFEGGVKVVDFGVAKAADRMTETRAGTVKGKISYLSPEQCRGGNVDRRTDLYALGIVFWEMLTLERLYKRASDFDNMSAIVNEATPPPSSRGRALPPELDALVLRLLAKDPADRYQTADEVIEAIEQLAAATGSMLSPSSLGRLLREMFGHRPEPWLEMDPQEVPEGVTVTGQPIPPELEDGSIASLDVQLAGVPDLSSCAPDSADDGVPQLTAATVSGRQRVTTPVRPQPQVQGPDESALSATGAPSDLAPRLPPPPIQAGESALVHGAPPPAPLPLLAPPPTLTEGPPATVGSGPHAVPASGAHALPSGIFGAEVVEGADRTEVGVGEARGSGEEKPIRRWPMLAVILGAMVIGSLTVWMVMKADGGARMDAAAVHGVAAGSAGGAGAANVAGAASGPIVTPIEADPGVPAAAQGAAGKAAAAAPAVPAAAVAEPAAAPTVAAGAAAKPPVAPQTPLEAAMAQQRYADAAALCAKQMAPGAAAVCTLAACHARLDAKARAWLQQVPASERARLLEQCRSLGIDPVPPRPGAAAPPRPPKKQETTEEKCARNPMSCQY
jgi:serine/threonine protein kinase